MPTPSEKIAQRYADIFVSAFDRIVGDPASPLLVGCAVPNAGANGVPFRGCNALLTSIISAGRGFNIPVWLTRSRLSELGLLIRKGEKNTPIVHYDVYYEDVNTKKRDPQMNDALYRALSDEDKKQWVKRCYMTAYPEFNVAQTNFSEVYPEQWEELVSTFGTPERIAASCGDIDRAVGCPQGEDGAWLCPIKIDNERKSPVYREAYDDILVPPKESYADQQRWYADIVHEMAHSTGSEARADRNLSSGVLEERAHEEMVAELAGATVCTMLGVQTGIQEHNLGFLKAWSSVIKNDPMVIYKAVNEASKAAEMISGTLGLEMRRGFNLDKIMEGVEKAQETREKVQQQRAQRQSRGGKKARRPLKVAKAKGRHV